MDDIKIEKDQSYKFEEYSCFYCDTFIQHEEELDVHKRSCHETVIALVDSFICDKCGKNCMNEDAFNEHKTWYHAPWSTPGMKIFWCNLCIMNYGTQEGLQTHRRN